MILPTWKQALRSGDDKAPPELIRLGVGVSQAKAVDDREEAIAFVMNGSGADRGGDIVNHDGARLDAFNANPVMPWGHNYYGLPLGTWEDVRVESGSLVGVGVFSAREIYPLAETILQMYLRRILRACSIGFRPIKWAWNEERGPWAVDYMEYELLECSAVMIGQHQDALATLSLARGEGLDVAPVLEEFERVIAAEGRGLWLPRDVAKSVLLELGPRFFDLAPATKARAEILELDAPPLEEAEELFGTIKNVDPEDVAVVPVIACASCGGSHKGVAFLPLAKAAEGGQSHWGTCPETGDPVYLGISTSASAKAPPVPEPEASEEDKAAAGELLKAMNVFVRDVRASVRSGLREGETAVSGALEYDD